MPELTPSRFHRFPWTKKLLHQETLHSIGLLVQRYAIVDANGIVVVQQPRASERAGEAADYLLAELGEGASPLWHPRHLPWSKQMLHMETTRAGRMLKRFGIVDSRSRLLWCQYHMSEDAEQTIDYILSKIHQATEAQAS